MVTKESPSSKAADAKPTNVEPIPPFRLKFKSTRKRREPAHDNILSSRYFVTYRRTDNRAPLSQYDSTSSYSHQDNSNAAADAGEALFNRTPAQAKLETRLSPPSPPRHASDTHMEVDGRGSRLPEKIILPDLPSGTQSE